MNENADNGSVVKNVAMLALALAFGAVGVYVANNYINEKISLHEGQNEVTEVMVDVVVPKRAMVRGEMMTAADLAVFQIPKKFMDPNAVTPGSYKIALGQRLEFDVGEGKPLLWPHLNGGQVPTFSGKLEDGHRAITIPVDEINSISGFLQPKDNVDLLLTYSGKEVNGRKVTFPFMQNLHVLATGVNTVVDKTGRTPNKRYSTITVEVMPQDAKKIILAQEVGKITAALRHPDDSLPMNSKALEIGDVLGEQFRVKPVYQKAVVKKKKGIEFIVGGVGS